MSTPRDHHFIPVFYLKQWCNPNTKKLVEYTIKHGKLIAKPVGPRATGYQAARLTGLSRSDLVHWHVASFAAPQQRWLLEA